MAKRKTRANLGVGNGGGGGGLKALRQRGSDGGVTKGAAVPPPKLRTRLRESGKLGEQNWTTENVLYKEKRPGKCALKKPRELGELGSQTGGGGTARGRGRHRSCSWGENCKEGKAGKPEAPQKADALGGRRWGCSGGAQSRDFLLSRKPCCRGWGFLPGKRGQGCGHSRPWGSPGVAARRFQESGASGGQIP